MVKSTINLILDKEHDPVLIRRLRIILPVIAGISLLAFIIIFIISLNYTKNNISIFNAVKQEIAELESKIDGYKNIEGVYTITYKILEAVQSIQKNDKPLSPILSEINTLNESDLSIVTARADINGDVNLSMIASSAASLNKLVQILKAKEEEEINSTTISIIIIIVIIIIIISIIIISIIPTIVNIIIIMIYRIIS